MSAFFTFILIKSIDKLVGANIDVETELKGLDVMEIGEIAYGIENDDDQDEKLGVKLLEFAA